MDIDEAFKRFHEQNPDFYAAILRIARLAKAKGKTRLSMRLVFEVIRYERTLEIVGAGEYRVNNSYTPFYARMIKELEPGLGSLFEIRESKKRADLTTAATDEEDDEFCYAVLETLG